MDRALLTATAAVLSDVDLATYLADKCVKLIPSAHRDLAWLRIELRNFYCRLRQIKDEEIPRALQAPFIGVINACSGICKRIGDILAGCGEDADPTRCWALVSAPTEIRQLRQELVQGRRTIDIVERALTREYHEGLFDDIDDLRQISLSRTSPSYGSIVSCLDAVEIYISKNHSLMGSSNASHAVPGIASSLSIQEMVMSFRRSSLQDWEARDSAIGAMDDFDPIRDLITTKLPSHPSQDTLDGENQLERSATQPDRSSIEHHGTRPLGPRLSSRNQKGQSRRAPVYALFPPASAPPVRALPPIPSPRALHRPIASPTSSVSTRVTDSPVSSPTQAREWMSSDLRSDNEFYTSGSTADRLSGSSKESSVVPLRLSSFAYQARPFSSPLSDIVSEYGPAKLDIVLLKRLENDDHESFHGGVYSTDICADSTVLASRHGKFHIRLWDLQSGAPLTTIKVPFYVQIQPRSRDYFVRSHAILSETLNLIAIAAGFGQSIEIWNWSKRKKLQTIDNALRWAAVRSDVYESCYSPLATYSEDDNVISLYPVSRKKPLGKPRKIDLRKAGLPHLPKLPELAFSPTGPLLIAAAGPRPPRPGNPPPAHAALLMVWQLDGDQSTHIPYKFFQTTDCPDIENSLPLHLATYGSVAVSIWEPAKFRTIGRPGLWQVEPVTITERVVLIWDFSGPVDKTSTYLIPAVLTCISPDCRFVAYCDPGGRNGSDAPGALVVLDITGSGRELWRLQASIPEADITAAESSGKSSRWSRRSSDAKRIGHRSDKSLVSVVFGTEAPGLDLLAQNLKKVTELQFSGDGSRLVVGNADGEIGIYEFRLDGVQKNHSVEPYQATFVVSSK